MNSCPSTKSDELRAFHAGQKPRPMMADLYRNAEARLGKKKKNRKSKAGATKSAANPERLLHELQVHQVELEMQNAELLEARSRVELLLEKYTDLYDFAPVGYLSLDEQGQILEVNLSGAALLGVGRGRLVNRRLTAFVTQASRAVFLAFLKRVFAAARQQTCQAMISREDGTSFWAGFHGVAANSLNGARQVCRISISDINLTKLAEESLRASEERFRALFELGPVAIYSCDASGLIQQFNRRAEELWGRTPGAGETREHFCGSFKMFRPNGGVMNRENCPMADVLRGKTAEVREQEVILEQPGGSRLTCVVNIRPLKNEGGKIVGAINCFYDVTERKRAEAAQRRVEVLAASNEKLENEIVRRKKMEESLRNSEQDQRRLLAQSDRMQEQLRHLSRQILRAQEEERKRISRELHDVIAQTLTGINVRLAALAKKAAFNTRGLGRNIAHTQRLVERSVEIVHRFARELRPAVLDDLGLIPALHSFVKIFSQRTRVHVHLKVFAGVEQLDNTKRTILYRVAQEALTNVARHAQASRVEVNIQKLHDRICMKIKDDGKSFSVERTLHVKRVKRLGLLGMRERLEMVGGNFCIESVPGKGTTVRAELPLANDGVRGGGAENQLMESAKTRPKIL